MSCAQKTNFQPRPPQADLSLLALCERKAYSLNLLFLGQNISLRTNRRDTELVDLRMTLRVVFLDVLELRRLPESRHIPIQCPEPTMNRWVSGTNVANIALEVLHVDGVEAYDGGVESYVCFGDVRAEVERSRRGAEVFLDAVEREEELDDGFLVGFLRGGEAGFVNAVVDVVVCPFVGFFDGGFEIIG